MKTYLFISLLLLIALPHALKAQEVSDVGETPVPGAFTPATPPRSAEDVRSRVEQLQEQAKPINDAKQTMEKLSATYERKVMQALDSPISEIEQKIDAARNDWIEGIGRESSRVQALLIPVLTTARGLSSWATVKLRTVEVTLTRRIRESERHGETTKKINRTASD